jgi:hypothetical protein
MKVHVLNLDHASAARCSLRNSRHIDYAVNDQAKQWVVRRHLWHARYRGGDNLRISLARGNRTAVSPAGTPVSLPVLVIETTIAGVRLTATTPAPNVLAS